MADSDYPARGPRYQETFPALTAREIDRLRRYGSVRKYSDGEKLFEAGKISPGMFVVLKGVVALTQRDGLGHLAPIVEQGEGQFLADVGQLSTRATLVDGTAEGDVETLLIPTEGLRALLVAEADLGERIMRALILRRGGPPPGGAGGAGVVGSARARGCADRLCRRRGRDPTRGLSDQKRLSAPFARSGPRPRGHRGDRPLHGCRRRIASRDLSRRLGAWQSIGSGCVTPDRLDGAVAIEFRLRRRGGRRRTRGPLNRGLWLFRRPDGRGSRRPRLRRSGRRQRPDRELLWLPNRNKRPGAHRPRLRSGAEIRRRRHDTGRRQDDRLFAPQRRFRARGRGRRAHSGADDRGRQRRTISPSDNRRYCPV